MIHRAGEVRVEDKRYSARFAEAALGERDPDGFNVLGGGGLMRMGVHGDDLPEWARPGLAFCM
jgi:hypothetical protein